ncbi:hypothetical protein FHS85_004970 [Rhodoligotrophos appendicifer]|uniref:hypothetical protein n=1 Tax=Rhodoligotrophos appendicifer TaxID=987056 RepID=UPI0014781706|nr:hypothetical protein [Rhodoligotrophos appendicifer]
MRHWSPAEFFIVALCVTIALLLAVIGDLAEQARLIRSWSAMRRPSTAGCRPFA